MHFHLHATPTHETLPSRPLIHLICQLDALPTIPNWPLLNSAQLNVTWLFPQLAQFHLSATLIQISISASSFYLP